MRALAFALALLCVSALPAFAYTHVDGCNNGTTSTVLTLNCSLASAQNSGNLVVGSFSWDYQGPRTISSVQTDKGDTCAVIDDKQNTSATLHFEVITFNCGPLSDGSQTITATLSGTAPFLTLVVDAYSGVNTLDQHAINDQNGVSSGITSGNVTTTQSNELVYGATANSGTGTIGAGSGFTQRQSSVVSGNDFAMSEDLSLASPGSTAATFTTSAADDYVTGVMTFYQAAAPTCPRTLASLGVGC